jgi:site-specific DNA-methyltransferase (adenine-specific)
VTPKDEWETPQWLFDLLNQEFHFDCDAAATIENTKCEIFFKDALLHSWTENPSFSTKPDSGIDECGPESAMLNFYLNPPYSAVKINAFMQKAYEESQKGALVVCLVPVSGDTWWINWTLKAQEIRYIRGRVKFVGYDEDGNRVNGSPMFSSCVVIFWQKEPEAINDMPRIGKTIEQPKRIKV